MTTTAATHPSSLSPHQANDHDDRNPNSSSSSPEEKDYNTQIDALLARYLFLLDEYTTLRSSLSSLQAGMYQNLARANFSAERGMRYGKEYFDERMVASRRVVVRIGDGKRENQEGVGEGEGKGEERREFGTGDDGEERKLEFRVVKVDEEGNEVVKQEEETKGQEIGDQNEKENTTAQQQANKSSEQEQDHKYSQDPTTPETDRHHQKEDNNQEPDKANDTTTSEPSTKAETPTKKKKRTNDPLRWFGLLTPLPLRQAQSSAIQAVEQIIPRLVAVNAEMAQVEIEVRRARKRREKAEKAAAGAAAGGGGGGKAKAAGAAA